MTFNIPLLPPDRLALLEKHYGEAVFAKRIKIIVGLVVLVLTLSVASGISEINMAKFFGNIGHFTSYIGRIFTLDDGRFVLSDPVDWFWNLWHWLRLIAETVLIAYLGTLLGGIGAFLMSFLAARNLVKSGWLRFFVRRYLEFCRTVPELVFAMIFVVAFGLGPLPGVLALTIHTTGALGKLFFEVIENADMKPMDAMTATGAGWITSVRFAILPQILSNFTSYSLLRFEINLREGAIMGLVGAGGIGQDLVAAIHQFYYSDISAILVLLIIAVGMIDLVTERIRHRLISMEQGY